MSKAIREHSRDFAAVVALLVLGLTTAFGIFAQQGATLPGWVPLLGADRFELRAELDTAKAVTPGQGQTVNVAGVDVGDVTGVELEHGSAVVSMEIENRYARLIRSDATMLLRPRTGLQDMTIELDPGRSGAPVSEDATVPLAQTESNVQPDQILASLDGDTRAYLRLLLQGGGSGLGGRGEQLSAGLRRLEPFARDLARIGGALVERRHNIRSAVSSFRAVSEELARRDTRLGEFVGASESVLSSFAAQEGSIRAALRRLPAALRETRGALGSADRLALELGPAARELIPAAQALGPALRDVRPFLRETVAPIREQIRPFTRRVRAPVRHLRQASGPLGEATAGLASGLGDLNRLTNALAYNPPGSDEGYLFWLAWLNHNTNALFSNQDAHGPLRRGAVMLGCTTAGLAEGVAAPRPFLETLQQITNVPQSSDPRVCPP